MNERKEEAINAVTEMYGLRDSLKTISRNLYDRCEEDYSQEINGIATLVLLTSVALEASINNALNAINDLEAVEDSYKGYKKMMV